MGSTMMGTMVEEGGDQKCEKELGLEMGQKYEGNYEHIMLLNRIVCIFPQKYKFSTIANMSNSNSKLFFTKELLINSTIRIIGSDPYMPSPLKAIVPYLRLMQCQQSKDASTF